jgi:hypothetical protein
MSRQTMMSIITDNDLEKQPRIVFIITGKARVKENT